MGADLRRRLQRSWRTLRCERGNAAMVFALSMPVLMGGAALGVETSFDYYKSVRLQAAADAAAFAGAVENRNGSAYPSISAAARAAARDNGWSSGAGLITVNNPPASGAATGANAVEVVLTENIPRIFSAILSDEPIVARARAVAIYEPGGAACILALSKTRPQAVNITGSASLTLNGCDVMSNSVADDAVNVWGSARITAGCISSAGGVQNKSGITLTNCPAPISQAPRVRDPFANLPWPDYASAQKRTVPNGGGTLQPGWYWKGMKLKDDVHLAPGEYYVSGGDFDVGANITVTGTDVTIFLVGAARVGMNGNSVVQLSAPATGDYAGILFFGDRDDADGRSNKFNGNAGSFFTGDLYFPVQDVQYTGSFSGAGGCTHIVANTVEWSGNATVAVDCAARGMARIPSREPVRLVG